VALQFVRAREYSELASHLYLANRPRETIIVARQALALDPNDADAHNNIAASAAALGLWDEAIQNAQQALRIRPDFPLARKNLAWALQAREKQIPR
jgi:tetratricopeptide (TPR) repeat protein